MRVLIALTIALAVLGGGCASAVADEGASLDRLIDEELQRRGEGRSTLDILKEVESEAQAAADEDASVDWRRLLEEELQRRGTEKIESWVGHPADDLVFALGPPAQDVALSDGRRAMTYQHSRLHEGTSYYCTVIFRSTAAGTISSANVAIGNFRGCDRLLGSIPAP
jgi:hypothetical protein